MKTTRSLSCAALSTLLLAAAPALAVPLSDGSIYFETFTGNVAQDPKTNVINTGATIANEMGDIVTTTPTEGVVRAANVGLGAAQEWVLSYDFRIREASGDNFYVLSMQSNSSTFQSGLHIRAYPVDASLRGLQIDYGAGLGSWFNFNINFNQTYTMTVHHKSATELDVWLDNGFVGTFADASAGLGIDLVQFGDGSGGAGYGSMVVDNISIGNNIPEPAGAVALLAGAGLLVSRRRK